MRYTPWWSGMAHVHVPHDQPGLPEGQARGVLVAVPGLKDHGGRYAELVPTTGIKKGLPYLRSVLRGRESASEWATPDDGVFQRLPRSVWPCWYARLASNFPACPPLLGSDMGGLIAGRFVANGYRANAVSGACAVSGARTDLRRLRYKLLPAWRILAEGRPSSAAWAQNSGACSRDHSCECRPCWRPTRTRPPACPSKRWTT